MKSKTFALCSLALLGLVTAAFAALGREGEAPPARATVAGLVRSAASALLAGAGAPLGAPAPGELDPVPLTQWHWERVDSFGVTVTYGLPPSGQGPVFVLLHPERVPDAYAHCLIGYEEIVHAELRVRAADGAVTTHLLEPVSAGSAWMLGLVLPAQSLSGAESVTVLGWTSSADPSNDDEALIQTYVARAEEPL